MTDDRWIGSSTPYIESGKGDAWGKEAAARGRSGTQRILDASTQPAPAPIAEALKIEPGTPVVTRQRLVLLDGRPIEFATSYWPSTVANDTPLASTGKVRGGTVTLLAELGFTPAKVDEDVQTRPPLAQEAEVLQLTDAGEWVLVLARTITASDGRPYEASVMVSPGRIGRLHYSMEVD